MQCASKPAVVLTNGRFHDRFPDREAGMREVERLEGVLTPDPVSWRRVGKLWIACGRMTRYVIVDEKPANANVAA